MGPLNGVRVVEIAGLGPGPFAGMMLSDMGADVLRIDRASAVSESPATDIAAEVLDRGRRSVAVDLKHPEGIAAVLKLVESADVLMEGFRPGVMERLGLGPEICLERNPRLVYGRMTGWGQGDGPMAQAAGHDINYIALAGALHAIGRTGDKPVPPLNLVGDFGGGGMLLAFGVMCALFERGASGRGQVVDAAMVDGTAALMAMFCGAQAAGGLRERGRNLLDGGAHFYDTYETSDGEYVAVGSIEPQFYAELLEKTGLAGEELPEQMNQRAWPELRERLSAIVKSKTRDEWCAIMEGSDVCFAPVLSLAEAPHHPQLRARETFVEVDGVTQPAPAPRFSRTPGAISRGPSHPGAHTDEALASWGLETEAIAKLREAKAVR